jgi:membrane-associated protease RseP (regulator of RpoE activity)
MLYVLVGVGSLVALGMVVIVAGSEAGRTTARMLGVTDFAWFAAAPDRGAWWRRLLVRLVVCVVPWAVSSALFFVTYAVRGVPESTARVDVHSTGAAHAAGMREGDRVLAIDRLAVRTWDELRGNIQSKPPQPRRFQIERDGQFSVLSSALDEALDLGGLSKPLGLLTIPPYFALFPLFWSSGRHLFGTPKAIALLAIGFIPCVALLIAASLVARLRIQLEGLGFRVGFWTATGGAR